MLPSWIMPRLCKGSWLDGANYPEQLIRINLLKQMNRPRICLIN